MEITESTVKWAVGLSNGESLVEGHGKVANVPGELSPWNKLQQYIKENDLEIRSLSLVDGDRHYNLPKGVKYNCFRKVSMDSMSGSSKYEHHICAESDKVQLWIDLNDTNKVWMEYVG